MGRQEDRLSKLARRLTRPAASAADDPVDKLFDTNDAFYKYVRSRPRCAGPFAVVRDEIWKPLSEPSPRRLTVRCPASVATSHTEVSPSLSGVVGRDVLVSCEHAGLRAHVRDALAAQLVALDAAPLEPIDAKMPLQGSF